MRRERNRRASGLIAASIGLMLTLTACTAGSPQPALSTSSTASPSPTPSATPTPTGPVLVPDGTASENLEYFRSIVTAIAAGAQATQGRAYIDALTSAGFAKTDMEVTQDLTTVGNQADSIQFSVKWKGECLVGQVGPSVPGPQALVMPVLPGGTCLVGQTRTIDW